MQYRHNHYVPIWYQRRFMLQGQEKYFRLDLHPDKVTQGDHTYARKNIHEWSPKKVFSEDDLYTVQWGHDTNTEIERFFFGPLDNSAPSSIDFFANFTHPNYSHDAFNPLLIYMSVQKLRTPKGLANLSESHDMSDKRQVLLLMQDIAHIHCAIWTECVWQIADASESETKFIISDHPVTVYNRACPAGSRYCQGARDPDIAYQATHTFFPLSIDKILILTNLSWVRNPYQRELRLRPNPEPFREAIFSFLDIQTDRKLLEDEVRQINVITKSRAYKYIAGAKKEWLFPEKTLSNTRWNKLGDGYLLMPEPRIMAYGEETRIGYESGRSEAFSEYGHKPWQKGFDGTKRMDKEMKSFERFKADWAMKRGAAYTAKANNLGSTSLDEDDPEMMEHYRKISQKYKRRQNR